MTLKKITLATLIAMSFTAGAQAQDNDPQDTKAKDIKAEESGV